MKNSESKKVLFLALSGIGNLVMQLPAIRAVKQAHSTWHITVWVAPRGTAVIARTESSIDEVLEMPIQTSLAGHLRQILALRKKKFDIGVILSPGQLLKSAAYLKYAGIPMRIGNTYPFRGNLESSFLLTDAIAEDKMLHDIEQNLRLVDPLGISNEPLAYYSLVIRKSSLKETQSIPFPNASIVLGIHPGSAPGFEWKRWPLQRFAQVAIAFLEKNPNSAVAVFGSKEEESQKKELVEAITAVHPTRAVSISASLLTTAALIQKCTLFLSNDSGLMHIAAAVGVPTLGLFGPTDEAQTGPRGSKSFTLRASDTKSVYDTEHTYSFGATPHESMLGITPKAVLDKLSTMKS